MQLHERETTLRLNSRPLRLIYLVRNREDLISAVSLYTHVWGGAANHILPIPENEIEADTFKSVLKWVDPDYIFVPRELTSLDVNQILEELPALKRPISNQEVQKHISSSQYDLLRLQNGTLSHMGFILPHIYPKRLDGSESEIRLIEPSGPFSFELALQAGISTQFYQDYLIRHLAAKVFSTPHTVEQLIKVSLLSAWLPNPTSLTMLRTIRRWDGLNRYIIQTNDEETLCLFLDDGKDIEIATSFWNCRWIFPHNKLLLPREGFLQDVNYHASLIVEFLPSIRALFIATSITREEALDLYKILKDAFAAAGREISVKVAYRDFRFAVVPGSVACSETINFTRLITPDDSVRFEPPVPIGHENTEFTFGYKAEVKFVSGRQFSMPSTRSTSILLANELWRIERTESNENNFGGLWLRQNLAVRAAAKGVTGNALSGQECRFYIHPDDIVITRILKDTNLEIKPNKHTRYAQGFVNRFGGFEKTIRLVNKGGLKIISVLRHPQAKEGGLNFQQAVEFLKQAGMNQKEAKDLLEEQLPHLLASRLVRRGYPLSCPHCDLTNWYPIENVGEFVECEGCVQNFQLSLKKPEFAYKPNELAARFVEEGGEAVLMTAALLNRIAASAFIKFGGDILHPGEKRPFAEVDLFWLTGEAFILAECKSYNKIESDKIVIIKDSLEKTVEVATLIDAQIVVLGIVTRSHDLSNLFATVAEVSKKAQDKKIGVHLVLNGRLYLWGSVDETEVSKVRLEELQVDDNSLEEEWNVGESPREYGIGGELGQSFDRAVLHHWEQELSNKN